MTELNIAAYLERIKMPSGVRVEPSLSFLREVMYRQVTTIPYENLDILAGKPLSLSPEGLFEKMVTRRRGGFCFEVNALLSYVLKQIGFEVRDCFARFLKGEKTLPARRHHVLAVTCPEGVYLADVGVGVRAPRYPVKLEEGLEQEQLGERYVFERDPELGWILCELRDGERQRLFSFTTELQLMSDFAPMSYFCERHPDSIFNKTVMVAMKTADGRKTVNDREYKVFVGDTPVLVESQLSDVRLAEILDREFGL